MTFTKKERESNLFPLLEIPGFIREGDTYELSKDKDNIYHIGIFVEQREPS